MEELLEPRSSWKADSLKDPGLRSSYLVEPPPRVSPSRSHVNNVGKSGEKAHEAIECGAGSVKVSA
jgi:hypothetical protein